MLTAQRKDRYSALSSQCADVRKRSGSYNLSAGNAPDLHPVTVRPAIRGTAAKQVQLRGTVRSARNKVGAVRDTAVRIDQEGLGLGAPSLPIYKPTSRD